MADRKQKTLDVLQVNPFIYFEERISYLEARINRLEREREQDTDESGNVTDCERWIGGRLKKPTIHQKAREGEIPHHFTTEGQKYFKKSEVMQWFRNRYELQ